MPTTPCTDTAFTRYRPWFYAAAIYNLVWGSINIFYPQLLFQLLDVPAPRILALWQVVGMFVLVYAPGYWWAARRPAQHRHIGLLGKLLGPIGFAWALASNELPLAFGWTILTNDLIWWPAFGLYLRQVAHRCGGWKSLLNGD